MYKTNNNIKNGEKMTLESLALTYSAHIKHELLGDVRGRITISEEKFTDNFRSVVVAILGTLGDEPDRRRPSEQPISDTTLAYPQVYHGDNYRGRIKIDLVFPTGTFGRGNHYDHVRPIAKQMLDEAIKDYETRNVQIVKP
jgi:hypothetical protein